jgi:hypothetical protein
VIVCMYVFYVVHIWCIHAVGKGCSMSSRVERAMIRSITTLESASLRILRTSRAIALLKGLQATTASAFVMKLS